MTLTQVWGALLIFTVCPLLGGLPLIRWLVRAVSGQDLKTVGTGNIGVSAAFYHGGRVAGILAVLSEAAKGMAVVWLARQFFPGDPEWELIALLALVMGRYWMGQGAGTTNVVWGFLVHDPIAWGCIVLMGSVSFTLFRQREQGRTLVLILMPLVTLLLHASDGPRIGATIALSLLLYWIYRKMPDDLDLPVGDSHQESEKLFRFFRGDRAIVSLDQTLDPSDVGAKAAHLSQLKRWGYPVPPGWVLPPGDDPAPLIGFLEASPQHPLVVRSSAIGEDSEIASAAGQYATVTGVTSKAELQGAIAACLASYDRASAAQYRRDRHLREDAMAVLIQPQIRGVFSGVAFSRDPLERQGDWVAIEALPGECSRVVSGRYTPERYRVEISADRVEPQASPYLPSDLNLEVVGSGNIPAIVLEQVAYLARHLENRYHGIPQDVEWTYDGDRLWILQTRPIPTLLPIWTRRIAAEVIPGAIRPLTWSINRPLTCRVWGEIFTVVLGDRARDLDFEQTATLHDFHAYFNATLLGEIFRRMGLPPESLEFLTRGAKFSKPPWRSTLRNLPGLLRLLGRELALLQDFQQAYFRRLTPALNDLGRTRELADRDPGSRESRLSNPAALLDRADTLLELLEQTTYYSILVPLSVALRQTLLGVSDSELDYSKTPEVAAVRSLQELATATRLMIPDLEDLSLPGEIGDCSQLFAVLAEMPDGQTVFEQFDQFLDRYGYLSDVATDIAVPTWREDPRPVRALFSQMLFQEPPAAPPRKSQGIKAQILQRRINVKARVSEVYSKLLAELRWTFVTLERLWIDRGELKAPGDLFFLELAEIRAWIDEPTSQRGDRFRDLIAARQDAYQGTLERLAIGAAGDRASVPNVVYGNDPVTFFRPSGDRPSRQQWQGIGVSPGQVEGRVKILRSLQGSGAIDRDTILVVPYTDSGWTAVLARAGGLIAEVGGQLSHGAIVAREYRIPAVMDVTDATNFLQDGQRVRLDGRRGIVEIL